MMNSISRKVIFTFFVVILSFIGFTKADTVYPTLEKYCQLDSTEIYSNCSGIYSTFEELVKPKFQELLIYIEESIPNVNLRIIILTDAYFGIMSKTHYTSDEKRKFLYEIIALELNIYLIKLNLIHCPSYAPPSPSFCSNGILVNGGYDSDGCSLPPKCNCAKEGEISNASLGPQHYKPCCGGLRGFDMKPGLIGGGLLCYDIEKGTPVCQYSTGINAGIKFRMYPDLSGIAGKFVFQCETITHSLYRYWNIYSSNYTLSSIQDKPSKYVGNNFNVYKIVKKSDNKRAYIIEYKGNLRSFLIDRYNNIFTYSTYNPTEAEVNLLKFNSFLSNDKKTRYSITVAIDTVLVENENSKGTLVIDFDDPSGLQNNMSYDDVKNLINTINF